jgi:hypothetical protein
MKGILVVCVAAMLLLSSADALYDMETIKCKVCDRAIAHIWNQGVELRTHCRAHGTDPRCDISNMHKHGIREMVEDVCDDLPKTHQALMESEFDLVAHDNPNHDAEVVQAIRDACVRWVHEEHTVESVTRIIYANLDAGKATKVILHRIQEMFCDAACKKAGTVYDENYNPANDRGGDL